MFGLCKEAAAAELPHIYTPGKVLLRLHNHPASFRPISTVLADQIGKLVTVRGTVTRATPPRPLVTRMQFVCGKCGEPQVSGWVLLQRGWGWLQDVCLACGCCTSCSSASLLPKPGLRLISKPAALAHSPLPSSFPIAVF